MRGLKRSNIILLKMKFYPAYQVLYCIRFFELEKINIMKNLIDDIGDKLALMKIIKKIS